MNPDESQAFWHLVVRLLITGATGFLGRHVRAALGAHLSNGVSVTSWDRKIHGNLLNEDHRNRAFDSLEPTAVIHLAWRHTGLPGYEFDEANRLWAHESIAMAEMCINRDIKVWLAGSLFGNDTENTRSAYLQSKGDIRAFTLSVGELGRVSLLEFSYIFSVEESRPRVMQAFHKSCCQEGFILENPENLRDYLEVSDAAQGIVHLLSQETPPIVSVCSGVVRSTADLLLRSVKEKTSEYALARQVRHPERGAYEPDFLWQIGWRPFKTNLYFGDATQMGKAVI